MIDKKTAAIAQDRQSRTIDGIRYPEMSGLPTYLTHSEARELIAEAVYLDRQSRGELWGWTVIDVKSPDTWTYTGPDAEQVARRNAKELGDGFSAAPLFVGIAPQLAEPVAYRLSSPHTETSSQWLDMNAEGARECIDQWMRAAPGNSVEYAYAVAQPAEPDPTLPYEQAMSCLIDKNIPGLDSGDILADAQTASAALAADPVKECEHVIADMTNEHVKSGFMCVECGALFRAAEPVSAKDMRPWPHPLPQAEPVKGPSDADVLNILSEYGDHNTEHGRIVFDKWTLREAGEALLTRYGNAAQPANESMPRHVAQTLADAIYKAAQKIGIANADHTSISVSQCLHLLDCMAQPTAIADAERYRWLLKQLPCNIADALHCSISDIGDTIDEAIEGHQ